jgi:hypothetical protein
VPGVIYFGAIDPAFWHDDFALVVAHAKVDGKIVLDLLMSWRGTKENPLGLEYVTREIRYFLDYYGITNLVGDQHCYSAIREQLLKLGIEYKNSNFGTHTRAEIFGNLKYLLINRLIELLDHREFLEQLWNLEERSKDRGRIDIQPARKMRDDLPIVVGLCACEMAKRPVAMPEPSLGLLDWRGMSQRFDPDNCPVGAICANFPGCVVEGSCQGFKDTRVKTKLVQLSGAKVGIL